MMVGSSSSSSSSILLSSCSVWVWIVVTSILVISSFESRTVVHGFQISSLRSHTSSSARTASARAAAAAAATSLVPTLGKGGGTTTVVSWKSHQRSHVLLWATGSKEGSGGSSSSGGSGGSRRAEKVIDLKQELSEYLSKRKLVGADEAAKTDIGKVVGGTKGNKVLDFVSGAPAKEYVLDEAPNVFDYSELDKYGYGYLAKPIMEAGGRTEMYNLMGLTLPAPPKRLQPKPRRTIVLDRTGETDQGRYKGMSLKMNDDELSIALQQPKGASSTTTTEKPKIREQDYELPFADKRNVGPQQTPLWTAAQLDEEGLKAGRAVDWARRAKAGAFVQDPQELMIVDGSLRVYSVLSALFVAFAFGKSTVMVLDAMAMDGMKIQETLQAPALAVVLANVGACMTCFLQAPSKNRNKVVWSIKGLLGGPLAISQLSACDILMTRAETDQQQATTNAATQQPE